MSDTNGAYVGYEMLDVPPPAEGVLAPADVPYPFADAPVVVVDNINGRAFELPAPGLWRA